MPPSQGGRRRFEPGRPLHPPSLAEGQRVGGCHAVAPAPKMRGGGHHDPASYGVIPLSGPQRLRTGTSFCDVFVTSTSTRWTSPFLMSDMPRIRLLVKPA